MHSRIAAFGLALACLTAACGKDPEVAKREYLKSGDAYVVAGKLNEALIEYRNAIQQDPRFGEARYKLAQTLEKSGDQAGAAREYLRAADLLPKSADAQIRAGNVNLLTGQFTDAETRADKGLSIDPRNVEGKVLKANALAGLKQWDKALTAMNEAIALEPTRSLSYSNLGAIQAAAGRSQDAAASYQKAVDVDAQSTKARTELAAYEWRENRRERAEALVREALKSDPSDLTANRQLIAILLATDRVAEAEAPLKTIAETTKDVESRLALADYYRTAKRIPEALAVLNALASDPKGAAAANTRKAAIHWSQGKKTEAFAALDAVLAKEATNAEALMVKAEFLASERRLPEALAAAEAAASSNPNSAMAHFMVGRLRRLLGNTDGAIAAFNAVLRLAPKSVGAELELSRTYLSTGRPRDTLNLVDTILSAQPGNADALVLQAQALMRIGDVKGAERPTAALLRDHASTAVAHVQVGDLHFQKRDFAASRKAYARALELAPLDIDAITGMVRLDIAAGNRAEARGRIDGALAKRPDSVPLLMLAGNVYEASSDFRGAERAYRRVIELEPTNIFAYGNLGVLYQREGRTDQAIREYEQVAARHGAPAGAHTVIGMLLETQNKIEEAKKRYEQALAVDPNAAVATNNLAWLIAEHGGNLDVALNLAQTARSKIPKSAEVADTLGWVYYKKGLFGQAVGVLRETVAQRPEVAAFHYHLGLSLARNGDSELARATLQKALSLNPNAAEAQEARTALTAIGG